MKSMLSGVVPKCNDWTQTHPSIIVERLYDRDLLLARRRDHKYSQPHSSHQGVSGDLKVKVKENQYF